MSRRSVGRAERFVHRMNPTMETPITHCQAAVASQLECLPNWATTQRDMHNIADAIMLPVTRRRIVRIARLPAASRPSTLSLSSDEGCGRGAAGAERSHVVNV